MIKSIKIENFALIENQYVEFCDNLNIFTGETGAGKSIFITALNFVLGGKADKNFIRNGYDFAKVELFFDIKDNKNIKSVLKDYKFSFENDLIVSRKISLSGKSEIRINGEFINQNILKNITKFLVDICSQHENQTLLNKEMHLVYLDEFIGETIFNAKNKLEKLIKERKNILSQIKNFGGSEAEREREKDMLCFQINEIEQAELKNGEEERLLSNKKKMENFQKIADAINTCRQALTEAVINSVSENCYTAKKELDSISKYDESFVDYAKRLDSLYIEAGDISESLKQKIDEFEYNDYEFQKIDERLDFIKNLKRKYGANLTDILDFLEKSKTRLLQLENTEELLIDLNKKLENLNIDIFELCDNMTLLRKKIATIFAKSIMEELSQMGMTNTIFQIDFKNKQPEIDGADDVEFLFSANLGQPLKSLVKVISGGELSRFMLAFKIIMGKRQNVNTLIFDEIDTGISGEVSLKVGQKLAVLSQFTQIITITHLATIASFANNHYLISKKTTQNSTKSFITNLYIEGQIEELSRLMSGDNLSKIGITHAKDLKTQSLQYLKNLK